MTKVEKRWALLRILWAIITVVLICGFLVARAGATAGDPPESRGKFTGVTSSLGYVSVEHGLGQVPDGVVASGCGVTGGTPVIPSSIPTDSYTATTFRARVLDQTGHVVANTVASFCWIAYAAGVIPVPAATPTPTPTPTPTTTAPAACTGPITITTGGTYSGCYQSTATGTPAVTVATAQPVTLDHAHVIAKGYGLVDSVAGVRLTVTDSVFDQTDPGAVVDHRAIALTKGVVGVDIEHNSFTYTDGIWIAAPTSAIFTVNGVKVNYNFSKDVGHWPNPKDFGCCVQFLQFTQVTVPGAEVGWNHTQNIVNNSAIEDNINFWRSGGTTASPTNEHDNLIDGGYPNGPDTQYSGAGINLGDENDHDNVARNNTVVSTTNVGIGIGFANNYAYDNLLVNDGAEQVSDFGQAVSAYSVNNPMATPPGLHTSGNKYNWHRFVGEVPQDPCYPSEFCSNGVQVATTEQQARDSWDAARVAAGVTVGPRP